MPFVTVENRAPPASVTVIINTAPSSIRSSAEPMFGGVYPASTYTIASTPPAVSARYAPIIPRKASHLPSTISARCTGFDASVCITPESISPESVSTGSKTADAMTRKFAT
jgi:hypothetical protein